jgi:hypothetical protein
MEKKIPQIPMGFPNSATLIQATSHCTYFSAARLAPVLFSRDDICHCNTSIGHFRLNMGMKIARSFDGKPRQTFFVEEEL